MAHFDNANSLEALAKALYENGNPQHTAGDRAMLGPFEELDAMEQTIWMDLANAAHNHLGAELRDVMAERDVLKAGLVRTHNLASEWELHAGPDSDAWKVLGPQKVSVPFAVKSIRAALEGE